MTTVEVENIAQKVVDKNNDINRALVEITPTLTTKQACKILGCERHWLSKNRHLFNGKVINRRGDMEFDTIKIIQYKNQ